MIKILPIHHVVPLVFLMPKWNSLYCISLGGWRMVVTEGSQKSLVLFLQWAECVQLLMELHGYQPGLPHTQGCAELCLTHGTNWPLLETYFIWIVWLEILDSKLAGLFWPVKTCPVWKWCVFLASPVFWLLVEVQRDPYCLLITVVANSKQHCIFILF